MCCVAAAAVHSAVSPAHFSEGVRFGIFFTLLAAVQIGFAVAILAAPRSRVVAAAALVNGATVVLWAVSRTVPLPFGLAAKEPIGALDLATSAIELIAVVSCLAWLRAERAPKPAATLVFDDVTVGDVSGLVSGRA